MATRIFIKNLPPGLTEPDFRRHFEKQGVVTDVRLLPKRRIGYIGYKTPEEAAHAVKYFNRSYIRTSKIGVEIAQAVTVAKDAQAVAAAAKEARVARQNDIEARKRKREEEPVQDLEAQKKSKKLQDFLDVMAPSSKSNTWNNPGISEEILEPTVEQPEEKTAEKAAPVAPKPRAPTAVQPAVEEAMETAEDTNAESAKPMTDDEWLRSKQSRLLDLADDVDERLAIIETHKDEPQPEMHPIAEGMDVDNMEHEAPHKEEETPEQASEREAAIQKIQENGRLFLRNLSYTATEEDLRPLFEAFGPLKDVHISLDIKTNKSKGFAYVQFENNEDAVRAFTELDGSSFQGRLLHILSAAPKRENKLDEFALAKLPLKKQRELKRKAGASTSTFNWNSMYMNADAVMSSVASRLGVSKSELLDPTSSDAAVKQAHAETHVIQETKGYLEKNGVDLNAFAKKEKDDRIILIKNFPFGTTSDELRKMLTEYGELSQFLMPPAGTIALAEFKSAPAGRLAFAGLAYRRFKDGILFLEKGPKNLFTGAASSASTDPAVPAAAAKSSATELKDAPVAEPTDTTTLFVRNLNFTTTNERLAAAFKPLQGFQWARVKTKTNPKDPAKPLSMGFGFVGFDTAEHAAVALKAMDGQTLEGHALQVRVAHGGVEKDTTAAKKAKDGKHKKIVIKNLPFEVTKKDITSLFGKYGTLRTVRMPKKLGNRTRGFAFAEFVTAKEAANAMEALRDTHLLGRRMVLDWATEEAGDAEAEIERLSKKTGRQAELVALQQMKNKSKEAVKLNATGDVEEDFE